MNDVDEFILEHFGTKGMKWGVRRDSKTGVRPIAKTLDESGFGKLAKANADRHDQRGARKAQRQVKRVKKQQGRVDQYRRVASGRGLRGERFVIAMRASVYDIARGRSAQGIAQLKLDQAMKQQDQIRAGKRKTQDILLRKVYGVNIRDLDFSYTSKKR
jgi:hypothetical protein